ncbi:putative bifunctional diguanylate cyclase/phosphodiesterase [Ancylobacter mangrovi]|uniref:putative bifunctional diguanylate cyclase/phosphodiesterase n=1 Tax=Ancylobacter mangrovi TaxID=2972472 RepID=UPI002162C320|nr:bifunctional diguanylate cyclase/phosphodiesterase [Ancylobacter mangrovi]MCS0504135.1 bifunctional diguanylate cyclase/phosphodiesterase [Ancylobacter mangrovi]
MSKAIRDALIVAVVAVCAYLLALATNFYDLVHDFLVANENWQADEILVALIVVGLAAMGYAVLRLVDLNEEIRRRREAEERAEYAAFHDLVTDLPNRRFVEMKLADVVAREGRFTAVFLLDINDFKQVNDLVGHHGGDQFLAGFAQRLRETAPGALIARHGGDEFVVVSDVAWENVGDLGGRIATVTHKPQNIDGICLETSAAIGFASLSAAGDFATAMLQAEMAMQEAKRRKSSAPCAYDPQMAEKLAERLRIETELREAIANDTLIPYFQPLVRLNNRTVYGFETLARWQRQDGSFVPPDVFIRTAENAGLITDLSDKLLRKACLAARNWPANLILAFNISPRQLSDQFLGNRLLRILKEVDFPPHRISIEITESAIIRDIGETVRILDQLRAVGVRIALDDFGTGYSSLAQLAQLPLDKIKIDRQFTANFMENDKQAKIVRSLLELGRVLEISMLAEGVETDEQYQMLRSMGCYLGQGYLFGRPMPAEAVPAYLSDSQRNSENVSLAN